MNYIWILLGMILGSLLYTAYQLLKSEAQKRADWHAGPRSPTPISTAAFLQKAKRSAKWISMQELRESLAKEEGVTVIDLRADGVHQPIASVIKDSLCIAPDHLVDVLAWIPAENSVVLLGPSEFHISIATTIRSNVGFAPVYVLKDRRLDVGAA